MKNIWLVTALLFAPLAHAAGRDTCVEEASNSELIRELERRIGGTSSELATATFFCNSFAYLQVSIVGQSGEEQTEEIYIGNSASCTDTASELQQHRSRIRATTVFAVCDSSAYLLRFSVTTLGKLTELSKTYIGNTAQCQTQQTQINTSR